MRVCQVVYAGIGDSDEQNLLAILDDCDGAYDLLDFVGDPDDLGSKIADSIKESDIYQAGEMLCQDRGQDLYLTVKIKFGGKKDGEPVSDTPAVCGQL